VVFDVGETLVDETRVWGTWADVVGVPRLTFMALLGAVIARGGAHQEVFEAVGSPHWERHRDQLEAAYGGFREDDLYPDVRPTLVGLRADGYRLAIFGNQPAHRTAELQAMDLPVEAIAMSEEMGVAKPAPAYFRRVLELLGHPDPASVAHVGDRVDFGHLTDKCFSRLALQFGGIQVPVREARRGRHDDVVRGAFVQPPGQHTVHAAEIMSHIGKALRINARLSQQEIHCAAHVHHLLDGILRVIFLGAFWEKIRVRPHGLDQQAGCAAFCHFSSFDHKLTPV